MLPIIKIGSVMRKDRRRLLVRLARRCEQEIECKNPTC